MPRLISKAGTMLDFKTRSRRRKLEASTGLELIFRGELDERQLLRDARSAAQATGTMGWARRRSDDSVEVVIFSPHGLQEYLQQLAPWTQQPENDLEITESAEAEEATGFRIRREKFILDRQEDFDYYESLGVDTTSRQFPALHSSGLLREAPMAEVQQSKQYWRDLWGRDVDPSFHIAFSNVTRSWDHRVVPQAEYRTIWRALNPGENLIAAYSDKVLFSRLVPTERQPRTPLVCIDGRFYDADANWIVEEAQVLAILSRLATGIIKPTSMDNGRGVELLKYAGGDRISVGTRKLTLRGLKRRYRQNFMVQEIVQQHPTLAAPHPDSLNTLRVVTLRWNGGVHHLLTFARFGVNGRINDNAGTGGLCVGVQPDGSFNTYAINEHGTLFDSHPDTNVSLESMPSVPGYSDVLEFAKGLHQDIPYFDLLSWDLAIDDEGRPVLIECNFRGAVWLYQLATGQPLFGEFTEGLLGTVRESTGR